MKNPEISKANGIVKMIGSVESVYAFLRLVDADQSMIDKLVINIYPNDHKNMQATIKSDPNHLMSIDREFRGGGLPNYSGTILYLFKYINELRLDDNDNFQKDWTIENEEFWQQLNKEPIILEFEYSEIEVNAQILSRKIYRLEWTKNNLLNPSIILKERMFYPYDAEHIDGLVALPDYDVFDYSAYALNKLEENYERHNHHWENYIKSYANHLDVTDLNKRNSFRHRTFRKAFEERLIQRKNSTSAENIIHYSLNDWLNDDWIQQSIVKIIQDMMNDEK